jgi:acyl-coenzyme A synthetase/AMP-(fatty) acid ligase
VYGGKYSAFLILKPGETSTEPEMVDYCRGKPAKFFVPERITFVPSLPKSLAGKIEGIDEEGLSG